MWQIEIWMEEAISPLFHEIKDACIQPLIHSLCNNWWIDFSICKPSINHVLKVLRETRTSMQELPRVCLYSSETSVLSNWWRRHSVENDKLHILKTCLKWTSESVISRLSCRLSPFIISWDWPSRRSADGSPWNANLQPSDTHHVTRPVNHLPVTGAKWSLVALTSKKENKEYQEVTATKEKKNL